MILTAQNHIHDLLSGDSDRLNAAYLALLEASDKPVGWAYEVWDTLVSVLKHKDNRVRSVAAQVLANLSQSDPEFRMERDFPALLAVTHDPRTVTARHALQAIWKVGAAGKAQRELLLGGLAQRFEQAASEKNGTLVRYDIQVGLRKLYDLTGDTTVMGRALALLATETDPKYHKKYADVWRGV